ncbi:MAG TPA: aspartate/glutamate racemase family protein [Microvirga sp.]|nr:aspartate/glutamate racemase family protein [Microvirga sp.]
MRTLGLLGGMSWESTAIYYRHLNELARERLGGLHSAKLLLWSFDFAEIAALQRAGDWDGATVLMIDAASQLENAGADGLLVCSNTMHRMAEKVEAAVSIPLIHIGDATAAAVKRTHCRRPALLATRFTMEQDFYKERLRKRHGIEPLVPGQTDREIVHRIIYEELCRGEVRPESKRTYLDLIARLRNSGADGVILGCTEITMLIGQDDLDVPVFDTTRIHAESAIEFALTGSIAAAAA